MHGKATRPLVAAAILLMTSSASFAADKVLKVGWISELSGAWTFLGTSCIDAARIAESEVNASGKKIELVIQDDQTNPATAATAARQLDTQDKVDIFSGPTNADTSLAVYGYAEENKIPFLVPVAAFPRLTRPGTKYTFRIEPDAVGWGYAAVKRLKELKPDVTLGIMMNDFAANKATLAGIKYQAEKEGVKIVSEVMFPQSATDATVQVAQMKAKRPDYIIVTGGGGAFDATLVNQLIDVGFKPDQLWHPVAATTQILGWGPRGAGSQYATFFDHNLPNLPEAGKKFIESFQKAKGRPPGYIENYCYVTIHMLSQIADDASKYGGGREGLRTALSKLDTKEPTTGLPIRFDQNGARIEYLYFMQVKEITKAGHTAVQTGYMEWSPEALPVYELAP
jgi:ABC-type branched-subunit amino acid transport system substrate-binding protein